MANVTPRSSRESRAAENDWIDADLVGAVAVEQQRRRSGAGRPVELLPTRDERDRDPRTVRGGRPDTPLLVVGGVVATQHRLALEQPEPVVRDDVVEDGCGRHERAEGEAQGRLAPLRVAADAGCEEGLVEVDLLEPVGAEHRDTGEPIPPERDRGVVTERGHALEPRSRAVGDHHVARTLRIGHGHRDDLEALGAVVVQHVEPVLAIDHGVRDVVLHAFTARPDDGERAGGVGGVEEQHLARDLRAELDLEVLPRAGEPDADPVPLVRLGEDLHRRICAGAELVSPDGVRAPGVVDGRVEDIAAVGARGWRRASCPGHRLGSDPRPSRGRGTAACSARHRPCRPRRQQPAVGRDVEASEGEELVALRLDVRVEHDLLALHRHARFDPRRRPVVGSVDRRAARGGVLLALLGARVVPPGSLAGRHGEVGLLHAGLDLVEDPSAQSLQVRKLALS